MREVYTRLNMVPKYESETVKFINRIYSIIDELEQYINRSYRPFERPLNDYAEYLKKVLGLPQPPLPLRRIYREDDRIDKVILTTQILLDYSRGELANFCMPKIEEAIGYCALDIGYIFNEGSFYPSGGKELDKPLVIEALEWIKICPSAQEHYTRALKHKLEKKPEEVITDSYSAVESLAKYILKRDAALDKLIDPLLKILILPQEWKAILKNFCVYAHEYGTRHGGRILKKPSSIDVEAHLYMAGLLIRLIIQHSKTE